jgi:hypothetical protein
MQAFICRTCGVQYTPSEAPPAVCIICADERQYIGRGGQRWTTLPELRAEGFHNEFAELEPGIWSIRTRPQFAIGQRAILVQTPAGNVLWDCISHLDRDTIDRVRALGGIAAIGVSHPHFYATAAEWCFAFGAQLYIPHADRVWVTYPGAHVRYWSGAAQPVPDVTLVQCGGHFEGSAVLHWPAGAEGRGVLLTGDTFAVASDARFITIMRSYPNYIPLSPAAVRRVAASVDGYGFDRIYGGFEGAVEQDAKAAIRRSVDRYVRWVMGEAGGP